MLSIESCIYFKKWMWDFSNLDIKSALRNFSKVRKLKDLMTICKFDIKKGPAYTSLN